MKEIGKFIQNIRTLGVEATKTLEGNLETQLQFDEIRKAQRELNDAFSFRRTINVDDDGEAFSTIPAETRPGLEPIITPDGSKKRKKVRRRKAVIVEQETNTNSNNNNNYENSDDDEALLPPRVFDMEQSMMKNGNLAMDVPDLDMSDVWSPSEEAMDMDAMLRKQRMKDRIDRLPGGAGGADEDYDTVLRQERMDRLSGGVNSARSSSSDDEATYFSNPFENPLDQQNRFVEQLSGNWNAKIMANEDKLEPLALLMERLAILEEEKNAADARLEEEFRLRAQLEEKYYRNKRKILEDAAADVQASAYDNTSV